MKHFSQNILMVIICGFIPGVNAQTYQVTVSNEPFVYLENPNSAVQGTWSEPVFQVPLQFDFEFFDITSNQLYSADNTSGGYTSLNQDEDHLYMLVYFYALLIDRGFQQDTALSPIHYNTEGLAGERVFTLEYNNAGLAYGLEDENGLYIDFINLQVRLYEATGDIEFHYGPYSILEDPEIVFDPFPNPIIGLLADAENTPGGLVGQIILLEGNALNPTVVTDSIAFLNWPIPENTVYKFSRLGTSVGNDLDLSHQPFLFPNPTSGDIHLSESIVNDVIYPIEVVDIHGKQVDLWRTEDQISAVSFSAGCYYVIFQTKEEVITQKLIVSPNR